MADPVGAVSLGLTVVGGWLRFYTDFRGQSDEIEKMAKKAIQTASAPFSIREQVAENRRRSR